MAIAVQLVPLPRPLIEAVSPARDAASGVLQPGSGAWVPLSITPAHTWHALAVWVATVLTFLAARHTFSTHGVREICRGVAAIGLVLSCAALVQRVASPELIYGVWRPRDSGALPFGPFVNRNHCATWLLMAIPLCAGYMLTRVAARGDRRVSLDSQNVWLAIAVATMTLTLAVSRSRSGILGVITAVVVLTTLGAKRMDVRRGAWLGGVLALALLAALTLADPAAVVARLEEGFGSGAYGRFASWRYALVAADEFWVTGSGAGTFRSAMLYFQMPPYRDYLFNQAHNHALQVAAEGGLLVAVPIVAGVLAFAATARRRLTDDRSAMFWIRAGALAGLCGVGFQSLWETGLRMPANALLAAVLAALVVHRVQRTSGADECR